MHHDHLLYITLWQTQHVQYQRLTKEKTQMLDYVCVCVCACVYVWEQEQSMSRCLVPLAEGGATVGTPSLAQCETKENP